MPTSKPRSRKPTKPLPSLPPAGKEYEAELTTLRSQQQQQPGRPSTPQPASSPQPPPPQQSPTTPSFLAQGTTRLSSLLYPRKSSPNALSPPPPTGAQSTDDLIEALTREKTLRREAENRLSDTSKEVEELSASLFEQANEMVADERRARAKLEQRVGELEKRDGDKRRRLERLEGAMERIERVRGILDEK